MPYTMVVCDDEDIDIPQVGERFEVASIVDDVTDMHWGKCTVIEMQPVDNQEGDKDNAKL